MADAAYYVELFFFSITVPLYVFILLCLFRDWRVRNGQEPFFKLCFVNGIIDIILLLNNNIGNVMPKACILPYFFQSLGTFYLHIYFLLAWGGGVCQGICVVIIAVNRLTIIIYPDKAKKVILPSLIIYFLISIWKNDLSGSLMFKN